ncbi:MAG: FemAB family PEP-CTERM system-associated protein [Gammaproteobacteria bacterium]|nr:FemAB family PEP-CTERM system-associated protein [Gammaproteobacteria bacterium]MDH3412154.1 FemAB family PEP-CTERM system-associated protein [Gammaproteobacteria bacterium]
MSQLALEGLPAGRIPDAAAPDAVQVRELQPADFSRWDEFVSGCGEATFFHRAGWKTVIERAFGHRTCFLYAEAGGRIEGVLPLTEVKSLVFGHTLVSLPFCVYGGIAAQSEQARHALDTAACALAERRRVDHLEYRSLTPHHPDWAHTDLYVTFRKPIDPEVERNLLEIPRKQRAMVRKGIKAGLKSEIDGSVERFFPAYADSVHRLGTPVFSRRYFQVLRDVFGSDCEVLTVTRDGGLIASVMSFYFRDEVLPYYGGGTEQAREVAGNDFIYWELMRRACERGLRVFDYGRSKRGTGSFDFKKNWGFEPQPLHYEYRLARGKRVPELNPLNPKYRLPIKLWQRLPLALANWIGPLIARNLG